MAGEPNVPGPFAIKDCALVALATGRRAQNLRELRDQVMEIHAGSLFHHFRDEVEEHVLHGRCPAGVCGRSDG